MWWIYAILGAVFAAATSILAKIGIKGVDSNLATAIRTVVILILAWGIVLVTGSHRTLPEISRHTLVFLILSGIATGLSWLFFFKALQDGKASAVVPIDKASLAITLVLAALFLDEPLTTKTIIGVVLILVGTFVIVL